MYKNLYRQIEQILEQSPEARDSDITLLIKVWQNYYHIEDKISLTQLYDLPQQDNAKRIRAKIQNEEHRFVPTKWEVAKKRGMLKEDWEKNLGYPSDNFVRNENIEKAEQDSHIESIKKQDKMFNIRPEY